MLRTLSASVGILMLSANPMNSSEPDRILRMRAEVSRDGKVMVCAGYGPAIRIWDVARRKVKGTIDTGLEENFAVAISGDGRVIASTGMDKTIRLWDGETLKLRRTITGGGGPHGLVTALALSSDGDVLVTGGGSGDNSVRMWELRGGTCQTLVAKPSKEDIKAIQWSIDGKRLAACSSDGTVWVWEAPKWRLYRALANTGPEDGYPATSMALAPDGRTVVVGGSRDAITRWEVGTGKEAARLRIEGRHGIESLAWSDTGKLLTGAAFVETHQSGRVTVWDAAQRQVVAWSDFGAPIWRVLILPGERVLVATSDDGRVIFRDIPDIPAHK